MYSAHGAGLEIQFGINTPECSHCRRRTGTLAIQFLLIFGPRYR